MSKDAKRALSRSIEDFGDISGIVINRRTTNILAGNHRWQELVDKYGKRGIELVELTDEFAMVVHLDDQGEQNPTGFIVRFVDWPIEKEKAANVAANSELISGEFTSDLQVVLEDISASMYDSFDELRFDELSIDIDGLDDDDAWADEQIDNIQKKSEDTETIEPIGDKEQAPSQVNEILAVIKISVPGELKEELIADLKMFINRKEQYKDVTVRDK